jgi:hypothetical protein
MTTRDNFFYKIAKPLIDRGIPVIPLRPRTKIAFLDGWQDLASTDPSQIEQWSELYPQANCGAVAQAKPGRVWFFEVDKPEVLEQYKKDTGQKPPQTFRVRSRPGRGHFYFLQNAASIALGNIAQNFVKGEGFSVRMDREYVVSAGSIHPISGKPYEIVLDLPLIEADDVTINWLRAQKLDQKSAGITDPEQPIPAGKRNDTLTSIAGKLRQAGLTGAQIEAALQLVDQSRCQPPVGSEEVHKIAQSVSRYEVKTAKSFTVGGKDPNAPVASDNSEELQPVVCKKTKYPVFPEWVMHQTSIYEGLVKPFCDVNSRYPEFMFMPAFTLLLNYIGGRVFIGESTTINGKPIEKIMMPSIFLLLIGRKGRVIKSSSVEDAVDYFKSAGVADWATSHMRNADGKLLIWSAGSPEGLGLDMSRLGCNNAVLFYDELSNLTKKAGIESSSLVSTLLTLYESGNFANHVKHKNETYSIPPRSYCASLIACTTDKNFHSNWSRLAGDSSGLDERFFFLYQPAVLAPLTPKITVDTSAGAAITRQRIDAAVHQRLYKVIDASPIAKYLTETEANRSAGRAEKFALGFAVDLGLDEIDEDCIERGIALSTYELEVKNWVKTFEATTREGSIQQQILHKLRQEGSVITRRKLENELNAGSHGTTVWGNALMGLIKNNFIIEKGSGKRGDPKTIVLIRDFDEEDAA